MKDELFKKVYIKTAVNLPKKEGFYIMQYKNKSIGFMNWWEQDWRDWLKNIDWYLQPIEEQESKPEVGQIKEKYGITDSFVCDIDAAVKIYAKGKEEQESITDEEIEKRFPTIDIEPTLRVMNILQGEGAKMMRDNPEQFKIKAKRK